MNTHRRNKIKRVFKRVCKKRDRHISLLEIKNGIIEYDERYDEYVFDGEII